jgi:hypothetical protein
MSYPISTQFFMRSRVYQVYRVYTGGAIFLYQQGLEARPRTRPVHGPAHRCVTFAAHEGRANLPQKQGGPIRRPAPS